MARRTNKKRKKTAILITTLHKKHYFAHEYPLSGNLVGISHFTELNLGVMIRSWRDFCLEEGTRVNLSRFNILTCKCILQ